MLRTIRPRVTPRRRAWLGKLASEGPQRRAAHGPAGYECMRLGWTEWDFRLGDDPISPDEALSRFGRNWMPRVHVPDWRERITDSGRAALAERTDAAAQPPPEKDRKR